MLRCWLESQASDNQAIVQVHSLVKPACLGASSPRGLACHLVLKQAAETTTKKFRRNSSYLPEIPGFQNVKALPGVDPPLTSATEDCISFVLLNQSSDPTPDSRDLQDG